ncbi:hypothetical protein C4K23_0401 [Pseudomonas chlororaphis]|nr:hypothetical protein C4K23_0401 [Pseudomonas chlororaphis]
MGERACAQGAAQQANQGTLRRVLGGSYAYVFTCTYKHMQSSGQLIECTFKKISVNTGEALGSRVSASIIFSRGLWRERWALLLRLSFAPRWGVR